MEYAAICFNTLVDEKAFRYLLGRLRSSRVNPLPDAWTTCFPVYATAAGKLVVYGQEYDLSDWDRYTETVQEAYMRWEDKIDG